jgi:beta-glucosidase
MKGLNLIQKHLIEHTRLGIPAMFHEECLAGVMAKGTTQFPTGLNYGAMWSPELVKRIGEAIGDELASLGVHQGLAPVLDVSRDVRWGRTEESMGEDPYLVGLTACSYISGFQGQDYSRIATLKHFIGHSASEGGRNHAPVHIGPRELYDVFALPFEMAVKLVKAGSVMPAYHDLDGEPCSASPTILKTVLRDSWGFSGTIVSDYEALSQLCHDHHVASDMAEAAALGIKAGIDIDLPSDTCYRQGLKKAWKKVCVRCLILMPVWFVSYLKNRGSVFLNILMAT